MKTIAFVAVLMSSQLLAQSLPSFPEGAMELNTGELQEAMAGKAYVTNHKELKVQWVIAFEPSGRFVFTVGQWKDVGKWIANESKVCSDQIGANAWCNEIRMKDGTLFLKSGAKGIVPMSLQK